MYRVYTVPTHEPETQVGWFETREEAEEVAELSHDETGEVTEVRDRWGEVVMVVE